MNTTGKCINFGMCGRADGRELITSASNECPECMKPLQPASPAAGASWSSRLPQTGRLWIAGVALACFAATGLWWWIGASVPDPAKADAVIAEYYPNPSK